MRQSIARLLIGGVVLASAGLYGTRVLSQAAQDVTPPYVAISSPGLDAIVSGTVTVTAAAIDQSAVAGVAFFVDGRPLGAEDTLAPFSAEWDAASSGPGAHILSAIARDEAGNVGDSELHTVVVGDVATPPPPPPPPDPNHAPAAGGDVLTAVTGVPRAFTSEQLLANDSDPDGDQPLVTGAGPGTTAGGTIASTGDGTWTYTSAAGFTGTDTFIYNIADGRGGSASGLVSVTVTAPVDPVPAVGLVAAFNFDETGGTTANDASSSGHVGTITGAARVAGVRGGALQFDGVDDWVTVPGAASLDLTTGMTLEAWVMPGAMTGWETVLLKERGTGDFAYALYAHDGGALAGGAPVPSGNVRTSGGHQTLRGTGALPAGTWSHLATTYDGTTQRLFVNGVQVASRAQSGEILVSGGALRIGGNSVFDGEFFEGLLDEVRIYNRALSADEIVLDMGGAAPPPPPPPDPSEGLVLRLDFDESSGDASDTSGLGHVGTISGAVRVAGVRGNALQFDGVDDWVTVADAASLDLTTGMTLEAWVKPSALTVWMTVVLKESPGGLAYGLYANDDAGRPAGYLSAGAGDRAVPGVSPVSVGAWTHVALTYDGTTMRLYVDGVEVAARAETGVIVTTAGAFRIGGNASWGEFFTGAIDEVRVYNRALSAAEIARDMGTM